MTSGFVDLQVNNQFIPMIRNELSFYCIAVYTVAAAAVTAATSDRGGRLAAVRLSLLWATFSPGTIAMVAHGINMIVT